MTLGTPPDFDRFRDEVEHLEEILLDDDSWLDDDDEWEPVADIDDYEELWDDDYWELDDSWLLDEL